MTTFKIEDKVRDAIRTIPDFPKPGIQFKDISTLLADEYARSLALEWCYPNNVDWDDVVPGWKVGDGCPSEYFPDVICGLDSRGFLFGMPVAHHLRLPFVMCRKAGKLPAECYSHSYALEYGEATVEMHKDSFPPGSKVMLIDDLLATGGTMEAAIHLVHALEGKVTECVFITELTFLDGRKRLEDMGVRVRSLVKYG